MCLPQPELVPLVLGRVDYAGCYAAMQQLTQQRCQNSPSEVSDVPDQLWICEHPAVFTQGVGGRPEHILYTSDIPVIQTNRGGQVTYHGPGQVVAYPLLDLRRAGYFVRELVYRLEQAVIDTLLHFGITGHRVTGAPGVYVRLDDLYGHRVLRFSHPPASTPDWTGLGKIAALGLKVSHHCTYHGVALNVAMDLTPFGQIHPCGYAGLQTVDMATLGVPVSWADAAAVLGQKLCAGLTP